MEQKDIVRVHESKRQYFAFQSGDMFLEARLAQSPRIQVPLYYLPGEIKLDDRLLLDNSSYVTYWKPTAVKAYKNKLNGVPVVISENLIHDLPKGSRWVLVELEKLFMSFGGIGTEVARPIGLVDPNQKWIQNLERKFGS